MELFIWITIFVASLIVLVKGADWLLESAERIGVAVGLSPFIVGVLLVGVGTSFPELVSSLVAVKKGVTEIVVANAVGSNIANILLVVGLAAVVARRLVVTKNLIDLDLPLVALSTVALLGVIADGAVTRPEALILILGYIVYFFYTISEREKGKSESEAEDVVEILPGRKSVTTMGLTVPSAFFKNVFWLVVGAAGLSLGAKYLIDSVIALSTILNITPGVISLAAVAFGTSLPEVLVSLKAAMNNKSEVALGNIFGSNVFNILGVVGISGLITPLAIDAQTLSIGVPVLMGATVLFVISGISKRIHNWEGWMFLLIYILFIGKLFGLL